MIVQLRLSALKAARQYLMFSSHTTLRQHLMFSSHTTLTCLRSKENSSLE